jgi:hypothetical protein
VSEVGPAPNRERSLAGTYLRLAVEHLEEAANPDFLYPPSYRHAASPDAWDVAVSQVRASGRRLDTLRSSVLFSALAAEAYANEFLHSLLGPKDRDAVDRMSTPNKYILGSRLVLGEDVFDREQDPVKTIIELFKLRHKLVHPKPGFAPPMAHEMLNHEDPDFTPQRAAHYLCMVALAAAQLLAKAPLRVPFDYPAFPIALHPEIFREFAATIDSLPERDDSSELPDLISKAAHS